MNRTYRFTEQSLFVRKNIEVSPRTYLTIVFGILLVLSIFGS